MTHKADKRVHKILCCFEKFQKSIKNMDSLWKIDQFYWFWRYSSGFIISVYSSITLWALQQLDKVRLNCHYCKENSRINCYKKYSLCCTDNMTVKLIRAAATKFCWKLFYFSSVRVNPTIFVISDQNCILKSTILTWDKWKC